MRAERRIVCIQYTNPAGYPPLEHAAHILAGDGWDVMFLGAAAHGADALRFPPHLPVAVRRFRGFGKGLLQKLNYVAFVLWVIGFCIVHRPRWVYASDTMAAWPALVLRALLRCRVVYHEHDSPGRSDAESPLKRLLRWARGRLARVADVCVLPQEVRRVRFLADTGRTGPTICVWNCPRLEEIASAREPAPPGQAIHFYYHGSINRDRLPPTVLDALAQASPDALLTIVGYETIGSLGYLDELRERARRHGLDARVAFLSAASRFEVMALARKAHVGLSFMPTTSADANLMQMVGASNKPFDYLAAGMALLVSDLEEWRRFYVTGGCALACDPANVTDLASAMAWCCANPDRVREMGEIGRRRIVAEWNYERQFQPVLAELTAYLAPSKRAAEPVGAIDIGVRN